ncbi:MAG: cytochrome c biogenesis protein CcdA [Gemmataceae bacterium]
MTPSRLLVACCMVAWGVLLLPMAPAQFEPGSPGGGKKLAIRARLIPGDPFSEANTSGSVASKPAEVHRGELVHLQLQITPSAGWYTYPLTRRAPDQLEAQLGKLTIEANSTFQPVYPLSESQPVWKKAADESYLAHTGPFEIVQPIYIQPGAQTGAATLRVKLRMQVCAKICTWEDHAIEVACQISDTPAQPASADVQKALAVKLAPPQVVREVGAQEGPSKSSTEPRPSTTSEGASSSGSGPKTPPGVLLSILTALLGGYASLLTPCVFPMIPITVSYFLKQSEEKHSGTLGMIVVYCGTLVLVLTLGGLLLLKVLVAISVHWLTNFLLGGIFLFFAMSLLGMYDITLPSWLQDATSSGEGKGGLIGVFFMALTFSIVSFACVGPIYGGFITLQASGTDTPGGYLLQVLPVLAFSLAFASPFFLLALFPSLLRSMPRAGSWMNSVKVVMGFLELAAVVKFLRAAELSYTHSSRILTFDFSLGLYVALCLACALYLLGMYRLPHDHEAPESISVPRLLFSLSFLSLAVYLSPGLWKDGGDAQRPRGTVFAWVESFLLPDTDSTDKKPGSGPYAGNHLIWNSKLKDALDQAQREKKLVFIDFTGMLCTNCKLNERNIFTRSEVQAALKQHVLLKLYTDYVPSGVEQVPGAEEAFALRNKEFNTIALPLYALLRPKGDGFEIVRQDEQGLIEDVPAFVKFLAP